MNLKEFTTTGTKVLKNFATISLNKKGYIQFNATAVDNLGMERGDKIVFYQDENSPVDWYFSINKEKGAELRSNTSGRGLCCNFADVSNRILKSTGHEEHVKFQIATQRIEGVYAIITKNCLK